MGWRLRWPVYKKPTPPEPVIVIKPYNERRSLVEVWRGTELKHTYLVPNKPIEWPGREANHVD